MPAVPITRFSAYCITNVKIVTCIKPSKTFLHLRDAASLPTVTSDESSRTKSTCRAVDPVVCRVTPSGVDDVSGAGDIITGDDVRVDVTMSRSSPTLCIQAIDFLNFTEKN